MQSQPVRYFHWNLTGPSGSVPYPNKTISSAASLVDWVYSVRPSEGSGGRLTTWVGAINRKSLFLSSTLSAGSGRSLLVFTRRRLDAAFPQEAAALREVAMSYHACQEEEEAAAVRRRDGELASRMRERRRSSDLELEGLLRKCLEDPWFERQYCRKATSASAGGGGDNCVCQAARRDNRTLHSSSSSSSTHLPAVGRPARRPSSLPGASYSSYLLMSPSRSRAKRRGPLKDAAVHNAAVSANRLRCSLAAADPRSCRLVAQEEDGAANSAAGLPAHVPDEIFSTEDDPARGLGCSGNRTLNFYLADSATQFYLARQIGLTGAGPDLEAAVIVDLEGETVYQMGDDEGRPSSRAALAKFVSKYHADPSSLRRLKLSTGGQEKSERSDGRTRKVKRNLHHQQELSRLRELSASDFYQLVLNSSSNAVLLYTSRSCGACPSFAHVFHSVQRLLAPAAGEVEFFSVDAGSNDLPWHFTALSVPSVLFFPAADKSETRVFPAAMAMNVSNLLNFVVANLPPEAR